MVVVLVQSRVPQVNVRVTFYLILFSMVNCLENMRIIIVIHVDSK
jgi:hypothetical protein